MLTKEQGIATFDYTSSRIIPDRLTQREHAQYVDYATRMIAVYQSGADRTRKELHRDVQRVFAEEPDCPQRRIDAFCKLLDDDSEYRRSGEMQAAQLRREVFRRAAKSHPLVTRPDRLFESSESSVKQQIAQELGREWPDIDRDLFADVIDFHRLDKFQGDTTARSLLSRYNIAQIQVALYSAESLDVRAGADFETILRYARLARLMHTIRCVAPGQYHLRLDGPASVLGQTRRYGVRMAKFLPALIACRDWTMHAVVKTPRRGWRMSLDLTSEDGLKSHLPPPDEFDSGVESAFSDKWGNEPRDDWTLIREGDILVQDQKTFVPDFTFQHSDGRRVLLEIVGFWTPEYLQLRRETIEVFRDTPILLAVGASAARQGDAFDLSTIPPERIIHFRTVLKLKDVLERLNAMVE